MSDGDEILSEPVPEGNKLSAVGRGYTEFAEKFGQLYGSYIKVLDLSHNKLTKLNNLSKFKKLESLVFDNNELDEKTIEIPDLSDLETLCLNNNKVGDVEIFLDKIVPRVPKLKYLSLLKNPACPHKLIGGDDDEYKRYRLYVLYRIPSLKFLDSGPITANERDEAVRRGKFCVPKKVNDSVLSSTSVDAQIGASQENIESVPKNSTHFGVCRYNYQGKQSEGNRFIRNANL